MMQTLAGFFFGTGVCGAPIVFVLNAQTNQQEKKASGERVLQPIQLQVKGASF